MAPEQLCCWFCQVPPAMPADEVGFTYEHVSKGRRSEPAFHCCTAIYGYGTGWQLKLSLYLKHPANYASGTSYDLHFVTAGGVANVLLLC